MQFKEGPSTRSVHLGSSTEEERRAVGIPEGLVRYAVSIEDIADLKADMEAVLSIL